MVLERLSEQARKLCRRDWGTVGGVRRTVTEQGWEIGVCMVLERLSEQARKLCRRDWGTVGGVRRTVTDDLAVFVFAVRTTQQFGVLPDEVGKFAHGVFFVFLVVFGSVEACSIFRWVALD
jgi:hypothetical protein